MGARRVAVSAGVVVIAVSCGRSELDDPTASRIRDATAAVDRVSPRDMGVGGTATESGAKAGLGSACTQASECASGFCASDVCCDSACSGVCETCSSSGACSATADDERCAGVACSSLDTDCTTYADITMNRCRTRGQCKTTYDCVPRHRPARTACGSVPSETSPSKPMYVRRETPPMLTCDGAGNCVYPSIACGPSICAGGKACIVRDASTMSCGNGCTWPDGFASPDGCVAINCDETADCPAGTVCCLQLTCGVRQAGCVPAGSCFSSYCESLYEVCSPSQAGECLTSGCTVSAGLVPLCLD